MSFYSEVELVELGFKSVGKNVRISKKSSFYGAEKISIGNNVRIDDFVVISAGEGGVLLGNHIHIAVYTSIIGAGYVEIADFANLSSRVSIYSSNDDYSGEFMTNPTVPAEYTNVTSAPVFIGKHTIIGCGCVVLPGVNIGHGVAVGALSLIKENCEEFSIYAGNPAKKIRNRDKGLLVLESKFKSQSSVS